MFTTFHRTSSELKKLIELLREGWHLTRSIVIMITFHRIIRKDKFRIIQCTQTRRLNYLWYLGACSAPTFHIHLPLNYIWLLNPWSGERVTWGPQAKLLCKRRESQPSPGNERVTTNAQQSASASLLHSGEAITVPAWGLARETGYTQQLCSRLRILALEIAWNLANSSYSTWSKNPSFAMNMKLWRKQNSHMVAFMGVHTTPTKTFDPNLDDR